MKNSPVRALLAALALAAPFAWATDEIFINTGNASYPYGQAPQIDARAFYNTGTFSVQTQPLPYDFQSVLNYTNRGTMIGSFGFQFDLATSLGKRQPSANFVNLRGGTIEAREYFGIVGPDAFYYPTLVLVSATNIVNEGTISVGNTGILRLVGDRIDLSRGGLDVASIGSDGGSSGWPFYINEPGIVDYYWGTGSEPTNGIPGQDSAQILRFVGSAVNAVSPPHFVAGNNIGAGWIQVSASGATFASGYTNYLGNPVLITVTNRNGTTTNFFAFTNMVRQAVVVGVNNTNSFGAQIKFYPSELYLPFNTVAVEVRMANTNVVSGTAEMEALYVLDRLASETNIDFGTNAVTTPLITLRPAAYEVWRAPPIEFAFGSPGNALVDRSFVYTQSFANRFVTNYYAGYAARADYLEIRPPDVPGMGPLDQPGRIEVIGNEVNLTKARFRGQGVVSIDAKHLISSSNAVVDAPRLLYNLGSTNGLLTVQSLGREGVSRLSGFLQMWSGLWTNQSVMVYSNYYVDATTNYYSPITNNMEVAIHVFILSANLLTKTQQVIVDDFVARSTNIILNDPVTVARKLLLVGESFTLNGRMSLTNADPTNGLYNFYGTNIPGIRFFTNNGVVTVPNIAYYGSDTATPLKAFVNHGRLEAFDHRIRADYYEDTGIIESANSLTIAAGSAKLDGGRDTAYGSVDIRAGDLKLRNQTITASGSLVLDVTNSLTDAGITARSTISVQDGFHLMSKPTAGDLLGTTFSTTAAKYASVTHTWAADDLGVDVAGYANNAAIGQLILDVSPGGELRFSGPADVLGNPFPGTYALYVDYLQMQASVSADPEAVMWIDPGFTIYFANANVSPETLDGMFDGHLRWVRHYAGPTSGTPVASHQSGNQVTTVIVNAGLLNSQTIDSDGDGVANFYDTWPFDGVTLKSARVVGTNPMQIEIGWDAAAETVYRVEYTPTIQPVDWRLLRTVTNPDSTGKVLTVTDTPPANSDQARFYRVRYDP